MNKSNLISILRNLDPREFREFGTLVHSPFFNTNQSTTRLYDYLKKFYPEFSSADIEKEHVFSKIFQKAEYNDGFMRQVIFNLAALAEEYLKQLNLKSNPAQGKLLLVGELNKRKLEKTLLKSFPEAEKEIEALKGNTNEYYYLRHVYEALAQSYINWSRFRAKNMKDYTNERIASENKALANYFLIKTLSNYRLLLTKEENLTVDYNAGLLEELMEYIKKNEDEFKGVPAVMLHVNEIMLLKNKTDDQYFRLKQFLNENGLTRNQKYSLHNILQTYCVYKGYGGDRGFIRERFELYKLALDNNFYKGTEDIYFDDLLFANCAQTAIKLGEFKWAEEFINKYVDMISPDNRDTVAGYIRGRLLFEQGDFENSLKTLGAIKSIRHHQYKVIIRAVMLMAYYELSYFDQADALVASYRQYMNKNEKYFAPKRFKRQTDFIKYFAQLLKIKAKPSSGDAAGVIVELNKNPNVLERSWLVEKAKELEEKQ